METGTDVALIIPSVCAVSKTRLCTNTLEILQPDLSTPLTIMAPGVRHTPNQAELPTYHLQCNIIFIVEGSWVP